MPPRFTKRGADFYRVVSLDRADLENRERYFALQARLKPLQSSPLVAAKELRQAQIDLAAHHPGEAAA